MSEWAEARRRGIVYLKTISATGFFADKRITSIRALPTRTDGNDLQCVTTDSGRYVVRRWVRGDNDPAVEVAMMERAAESRIAPPVLFFDEAVPVVVMAYVEGEHRQALTTDDLGVLAATLRRLHAIGTEAPDLPSIDLAAIIEIDTPEVMAAFETIRSFPTRNVFCHNDLNSLNLLWHTDEVTLIDFEYAGLNDPCFDLAAVSVEFDLNEEAEGAWMSAYWGEEKWQAEKLAAYKVLYRALCRQWLVKT
jgi:Ser/Thr protein kinase RdoA (MazF antagonist)